MRRAHRDRIDRIEEALTQICRSIERIEVATLVREPATGLAADAYEGLRRQVVAATGERTAHLVQLAQLAESVRRGDADHLPLLVEDWMRQAGLECCEDPDDDRYFDVLGTPPEADTGRSVMRPAYIDTATGRPVLMGQAEATVTSGWR